MTVAADPDPYFALPKLYGGPAYARPPRVVAESERPFDPDDLPIVAEMTDEERAFAAVVYGPMDPRVQALGAAQAAPGPNGHEPPHDGASGGGNGASGSDADRRVSLRALAGRFGSRPK